MRDGCSIGFRLKQDWLFDWHRIAMDWQWIYTPGMRAWQPHWLWYDIGLTSDWPRIGNGFILNWCDEDWHPIDFLLRLYWQWIDIRLAQDWHQIGNGLAEYWHRIGLGLIHDCHKIDTGWYRNWTGSALYWRIGDEVWHWQSIGFRLTIDWHRSGTGLTSDWQ